MDCAQIPLMDVFWHKPQDRPGGYSQNVYLNMSLEIWNKTQNILAPDPFPPASFLNQLGFFHSIVC